MGPVIYAVFTVAFMLNGAAAAPTFTAGPLSGTTLAMGLDVPATVFGVKVYTASVLPLLSPEVGPVTFSIYKYTGCYSNNVGSVICPTGDADWIIDSTTGDLRTNNEKITGTSRRFSAPLVGNYPLTLMVELQACSTFACSRHNISVKVRNQAEFKAEVATSVAVPSVGTVAAYSYLPEVTIFNNAVAGSTIIQVQAMAFSIPSWSTSIQGLTAGSSPYTIHRDFSKYTGSSMNGFGVPESFSIDLNGLLTLVSFSNIFDPVMYLLVRVNSRYNVAKNGAVLNTPAEFKLTINVRSQLCEAPKSIFLSSSFPNIDASRLAMYPINIAPGVQLVLQYGNLNKYPPHNEALIYEIIDTSANHPIAVTGSGEFSVQNTPIAATKTNSLGVPVFVFTYRVTSCSSSASKKPVNLFYEVPLLNYDLSAVQFTSSSVVTIPGTTPSGSVIYVATEASSTVVFYSLAASSHPFSIDAQTGEVKSTASVAASFPVTYSLTIYGSRYSNGQNKTTFSVDVIVRPVEVSFEQSNYAVSQLANSPAGSLVITLKVKDIPSYNSFGCLKFAVKKVNGKATRSQLTIDLPAANIPFSFNTTGNTYVIAVASDTLLDMSTVNYEIFLAVKQCTSATWADMATLVINVTGGPEIFPEMSFPIISVGEGGPIGSFTVDINDAVVYNGGRLTFNIANTVPSCAKLSFSAVTGLVVNNAFFDAVSDLQLGTIGCLITVTDSLYVDITLQQSAKLIIVDMKPMVFLEEESASDVFEKILLQDTPAVGSIVAKSNFDNQENADLRNTAASATSFVILSGPCSQYFSIASGPNAPLTAHISVKFSESSMLTVAECGTTFELTVQATNNVLHAACSDSPCAIISQPLSSTLIINGNIKALKIYKPTFSQATITLDVHPNKEYPSLTSVIASAGFPNAMDEAPAGFLSTLMFSYSRLVCNVQNCPSAVHGGAPYLHTTLPKCTAIDHQSSCVYDDVSPTVSQTINFATPAFSSVPPTIMIVAEKVFPAYITALASPTQEPAVFNHLVIVLNYILPSITSPSTINIHEHMNIINSDMFNAGEQFRVKATEPLDITEHVYSFSIISNVNDFFTIDAVSGWISVHGSETLEFDTYKTVSITVGVSDEYGASNSSTVSFVIQGRNMANPVFSLTAYDVTILQTQSADEAIAYVVASDSDSGSYGVIESYSLETASDVFTLNATNGEISVKQNAVFTSREYTLYVIAADSGAGSIFDVDEQRMSTVSVVIIITPVDHVGAVFSRTSYAASVYNKPVAGFPVLKVSASSSNILVDPVSYTVSCKEYPQPCGENPLSDAFTINAVGLIRTTNAASAILNNFLNNNLVDSLFHFTVTASIGEYHEDAYIDVAINIIKPAFNRSTELMFTMYEHRAANSVVMDLMESTFILAATEETITHSGLSPDEYDVKTFTFAMEPNDYFKVDPTSGVISTGLQEIDVSMIPNVVDLTVDGALQVHSLQYWISVTDSHDAVTREILTVQVLPKNFNSPRFTAQDPHTSNCILSAGYCFRVPTNYASTTAPGLDFQLLDNNGVNPIVATDLDAGVRGVYGVLSYYLAVANDPEVSIDPETGDVYLMATPGAFNDTGIFITKTVCVKDGGDSFVYGVYGNAKSRCWQIRIEFIVVGSESDISFTGNSLLVSIDEQPSVMSFFDASGSTAVTQLPPIAYSIVPANVNFAVSADGLVSTTAAAAANLLYSNGQQVTFTVHVSVTWPVGIPPGFMSSNFFIARNVTVTLLPLNNHKPVFSVQTPAMISVQSGSSTSQPIFTFAATSANIGPSAVVTFSNTITTLSGISVMLAVEIGRSTGALATVGVIFFNASETKYIVIVTATTEDKLRCVDEICPIQQESVTFILNVLDFNMFVPEMTSIGMAKVLHNVAVGTRVSVIAAIDRDMFSNNNSADGGSVVAYALIGNDAMYFAISNNGVLSTAQLLFDVKTSLFFDIKISDNGNPPKFTIEPFMVSIVKIAAPTVAIADIGKAVIDRTPKVVVDAQIDALFNINNVYTTTSMPVHFWIYNEIVDGDYNSQFSINAGWRNPSSKSDGNDLPKDYGSGSVDVSTYMSLGVGEVGLNRASKAFYQLKIRATVVTSTPYSGHTCNFSKVEDGTFTNANVCGVGRSCLREGVCYSDSQGECESSTECGSDMYCDSASTCYPCDFCQYFKDGIDEPSGMPEGMNFKCPAKCFTGAVSSVDTILANVIVDDKAASLILFALANSCHKSKEDILNGEFKPLDTCSVRVPTTTSTTTTSTTSTTSTTTVYPYAAVRTYGNYSSGGAGGDPCVFPFTYKGVQYSRCSNVDLDFWWCATTENFNLPQNISGKQPFVKACDVTTYSVGISNNAFTFQMIGNDGKQLAPPEPLMFSPALTLQRGATYMFMLGQSVTVPLHLTHISGAVFSAPEVQGNGASSGQIIAFSPQVYTDNLLAYSGGTVVGGTISVIPAYVPPPSVNAVFANKGNPAAGAYCKFPFVDSDGLSHDSCTCSGTYGQLGPWCELIGDDVMDSNGQSIQPFGLCQNVNPTFIYDGPIDGDASSCGTLALGEGVSQPGPRVKIGSTAAADAASGSASVGVIAGAVVGVVALIALITIVVVRVKRSRAATFSKFSVLDGPALVPRRAFSYQAPAADCTVNKSAFDVSGF